MKENVTNPIARVKAANQWNLILALSGLHRLFAFSLFGLISTMNVCADTSYVTGQSTTTLRNDYTGWVGMKFTVGSSPITVTSLGRIFVNGNSGSHTVKLIKTTDGSAVPNGSVTISMAGGISGQFKYAALPASVTLSANTAYYVASYETSGGDSWYDGTTTITTTSVAAANGYAYSNDSIPWITGGSANNTLVPVDFKYTTATADNSATTDNSFVTGKTLTTLRNDYTGWVGMKLTVGSSPITVTSLGRVFVNGNGGNHTVKLVKASDGSAVPNGSVTIPMAGGVSGQFKYAALPASVTLSANTAYYVASYETSGETLGTDGTTTITTTSVAAANGYAYSNDSIPWINGGAANNTLVPVDFKYTTATAVNSASADNSFVTGKTLTILRNDYTGWVGMKLTVGSSPITVTSLGRIFVSGNSGNHTVKLVKASDGSAVPNGSVTIPMAGGVSGQFKYAALPASVTLSANTAYYVASYETSGGDSWYDGTTTITTTSVAAANGYVYSNDSIPWINGGAANNTLVPVDFKYTTGAPTCTYSISPTSTSLASSGGSGTVSVTAGNACPWAASSSVSWITITTVIGGPGNGTVSYSVAANTSTSSRSGTLTIAGQTFSVTQAGGSGAGVPGAFQWGVNIGTSSSTDGASAELSAVDASGNVIVVGNFQGTVNIGGTQLISPGGSDVFIAKYSPNGSLLWAKKLGGMTVGYGVALDRSANIVVVGTCGGIVDFGGGAVASIASNDAFIAKYSSSGAYLWAKRFGPTNVSLAASAGCVAIDASDNVIFGGYSSGSVNLGGGLLSAGSYVAKYSASGAYSWSITSSWAGGMALDSAGNVMLSGSNIITMYAGTDGHSLWSKQFVGTGSALGLDIKVDVSGNILVTGNFTGTIDFGGGPLTTAYQAIFMAKYSAAGAHQWSKRFGGQPTGDSGSAIASDSNGNIFLTGVIAGAVDFGGGYLFGSTRDIFIAKFSASGGYQWAKRIGASYEDVGNSVVADANGNAIVCGYFGGSVNFGGPTPLTSGPCHQDGFVVKFGP